MLGRPLALTDMTLSPRTVTAELDLSSPDPQSLAKDAQGPRSTGFWARAVQNYQRAVVVRLLATGCPLERAQELTQETWTRLIEQDRLGRLPEVSLPGLAIRQALFLAKDALRKGNRIPPLIGDVEKQATNACQESRVVARDELRHAEKVLRTLPATAQTIFRLAYGPERPTAAEIAQQVGLSTQRVRQTLCEVRRRLVESRK